MVIQEENTKLPILHYSSAPRLPKEHLSALAFALIHSREKECKWRHNLAWNHVLVCTQGKEASELPKLLNKSGRQTDYTPWRIAAATVRDLGVSMWHHTVFCASLKQNTSGYMPSLASGHMPLLTSKELSDVKRVFTRSAGTGKILTLYCIAISLGYEFYFLERYKSFFMREREKIKCLLY